MSLLKPLGNEQGYLKAGLLGFQKSGKTRTSVELAVGTRAFFNLTGPIAMFDTESGSGYVAEMIKKVTGQDLLGVRSRSFADLLQFGKECVSGGVSVAIVDSVTHPWVELCGSYLSDINAKRKAKNLYALRKLEFQHWDAVKTIWREWADLYLNSPLHLIICGRAGFTYDFEKNDETGRKELIKTGTKMKVEGEFGFEPSLLIEMEREMVVKDEGTTVMRHKATVLGDRFGVIDGATCLDPTFEFFLPHLKRLKPGAHAPVDVTTKTATGADEEGSSEWMQEKRLRTIYCEEAQGLIVSLFPGQTKEEKKAKTDLVEQAFGTRSWTAVENTQSDLLRSGLERLKELCAAYQDAAPPVDGDELEGAAPLAPAKKGKKS